MYLMVFWSLKCARRAFSGPGSGQRVGVRQAEAVGEGLVPPRKDDVPVESFARAGSAQPPEPTGFSREIENVLHCNYPNTVLISSGGYSSWLKLTIDALLCQNSGQDSHHTSTTDLDTL